MALDYSIIGDRIKQIREKKNITQAKLAEGIGVSTSSISRIENGTMRLSLARLNQICEFLGVKEGNILNGSSFTSSYYLNPDMANILKSSPIKNNQAIYEIALVLKKYFS